MYISRLHHTHRIRFPQFVITKCAYVGVTEIGLLNVGKAYFEDNYSTNNVGYKN